MDNQLFHLYETIVNTINQPVILCNLNKEIQYLNYAAEKIFDTYVDLKKIFVSMNLYVKKAILERMNEEMRQLSFYDSLTGLYNRTYLEAEIQKYNRRTKMPISIIMVDLNNLKIANDTYGHSFGVRLLIKSVWVSKNHSS